MTGVQTCALPIFAPSSSKGLLVEHKMEDDYAESTLQTHKFTKNLAPGEHVLGVRLKNKTAEDTRGFNADGSYALDMLLNIEAIKIDGVDLQQLIHEESEYTLDNEHQGTSKLTRCTSLGHNGTYRLKITSPFYIWLLERL